MTGVREAVDLVLAAGEPSPAVVVDRRWNVVAANAAMAALASNVAPASWPPELRKEVRRARAYRSGGPSRVA